MNITKVLGSRVLVKVIEEEVKNETESGIALSPASINPSYFKGQVILVGVGEVLGSDSIGFYPGSSSGDGTSGELYPMKVPRIQVGDKVAFTKYGFEDMGDGQYLVDEESLLAVYE